MVGPSVYASSLEPSTSVVIYELCFYTNSTRRPTWHQYPTALGVIFNIGYSVYIRNICSDKDLFLSEVRERWWKWVNMKPLQNTSKHTEFRVLRKVECVVNQNRLAPVRDNSIWISSPKATYYTAGGTLPDKSTGKGRCKTQERSRRSTKSKQGNREGWYSVGSGCKDTTAEDWRTTTSRWWGKR